MVFSSSSQPRHYDQASPFPDPDPNNPYEKKPVTDDSFQDQSPSLSENGEIDWTAEEEKLLVKKYVRPPSPICHDRRGCCPI